MSRPARSMTGYARLSAATRGGRLTVSLRGVNHRSLDLQIYLPAGLEPHEPTLRKAVQASVTRGHIDVRLSLQQDGTAAPAVRWNRPLMTAWLKALDEASQELGIEARPDLNAAMRLPGMWTPDEERELPAGFEAELLQAVREALDKFNESREREGAALVEALVKHVERIAEAAKEIEAARAALVPLLYERLTQRIAEILRTAAVSADPGRIAQEAALAADRGEVAEEITRLSIHAGDLRRLLDGGGEMGKKIEFLTQEMHRETNTILSKAQGGGEPGRRVANIALGVKSEIEKIREQSLNLE